MWPLALDTARHCAKSTPHLSKQAGSFHLSATRCSVHRRPCHIKHLIPEVWIHASVEEAPQRFDIPARCCAVDCVGKAMTGQQQGQEEKREQAQAAT
jgi:hypothetical protein